MIWLNINELENKISENKLSEKDGFNYVMAYFILSVLSMSFVTHNESAWIKSLNCGLIIVITIWGLNSVYKANSEIDGKDFFKRFFAINWVIGMRMLFALVVLIIILGIVMGIISLVINSNDMDNSMSKDLIATGFVSIFEIVYYSLVRNSFRRLKPIAE